MTKKTLIFDYLRKGKCSVFESLQSQILIRRIQEIIESITKSITILYTVIRKIDFELMKRRNIFIFLHQNQKKRNN